MVRLMANARGERRRRDGDVQGRDREEAKFVEKLVTHRVAKVVNGGPAFRLCALVMSHKKGRVV